MAAKKAPRRSTKKTARKKTGSLFAKAAKEEGRPLMGNHCHTCRNAKWRAAIQDALRSMLSDAPDELSLDTPFHHLWNTLRHQHQTLRIEPYTLSMGAMRGHIMRCEKDLWDEIERRRLSIAS